MVPDVTSDLRIDPALRSFVADELLPGLDLDPDVVLVGAGRPAGAVRGPDRRAAGPPRRAAGADRRLAPRARAPATWTRYAAFLTEIGYLVPGRRSAARRHRRRPRDRRGAGPAAGGARHRPALRAERRERPLGLAVRRASTAPTCCRSTTSSRPGYDEHRGAQVIAAADGCSTSSSRSPRAATPTSRPTASTTGALVARRRRDTRARRVRGARPHGRCILLRRHGLHVELTIDPEHRVGRQHHADVADVRAGVGGHHDRRPRGLGRHRRRRGQGGRLPHLARPDDRRAHRDVREGRGDRRARRCTATASYTAPDGSRAGAAGALAAARAQLSGTT